MKMCSNNTGGSNCERCAEGFYGDPNDFGCESCPCPETHRNFAKGCTFHNGRVSCICKPGYIGDFCDKCASGFYGNPEKVNGVCRDCECNLHGSISSDCDEITGNCFCRDGISGKHCDKCDLAKSILQNGICRGNNSNFFLNKLFFTQSIKFILVCDNCTLTLLSSAEYLEYLIESEADIVDLDGIPAPWPRLKIFENSTQHLTHKLSDLNVAKDKIENYNDLQIDKVKSVALNSIKNTNSNFFFSYHSLHS